MNLINLRSHRTIQPPTHTPKHTHQPPNRQNYPDAQPSQPSTYPPPRKGPKWGAALTFSILMVFSSKKPQKTNKTEPPPKTQNPKTPKTPKHITAFACEGSRVLKNRQTEGLDIWGFVFFVSFVFLFCGFLCFLEGALLPKKNKIKTKNQKPKNKKYITAFACEGFRVLKNRQTEGLLSFCFFCVFLVFVVFLSFFRGSTASKKTQKTQKPRKNHKNPQKTKMGLVHMPTSWTHAGTHHPHILNVTPHTHVQVHKRHVMCVICINS